MDWGVSPRRDLVSRRSNDNDKSETPGPSIRPELVTRICWYHFHDGQTQQQVAERVGLSRATINKVINDARRQGIVRISIDLPATPCVELEARLCEKFGLRDAVVVPSPADEDNVRHIVGIATGEYVSKVLKSGRYTCPRLGRHHLRGRTVSRTPQKQRNQRRFSVGWAPSERDHKSI